MYCSLINTADDLWSIKASNFIGNSLVLLLVKQRQYRCGMCSSDPSLRGRYMQGNVITLSLSESLLGCPLITLEALGAM